MLILSGDHLYRMDYMDFVQVNWSFLVRSLAKFQHLELLFYFYGDDLQKHQDTGADITISCVPIDERYGLATLRCWVIHAYKDLGMVSYHSEWLA